MLAQRGRTKNHAGAAVNRFEMNFGGLEECLIVAVQSFACRLPSVPSAQLPL
jgi:hypothetical protein